MKPKSYTPEQRAKILAYSKTHSIRATSRKFGVSTVSINIWRKNGHAASPVQNIEAREDSEVRRLTEENRKLKSFVFEKMFLPTILG